MFSRFRLFFSFLLICQIGLAQLADPKLILEKIEPTIPDVAILGRYSMSPPNLSNGLPSQNIPLFEIKENGLSYPVSLFYSYSGFKVKEEASSVGLGWGLTEGMIIRIPKHIPDEHQNLLKQFSDFGDDFTEELDYGIVAPGRFAHVVYTSQEYNYTRNRLFYKLYDAQPDVYIYNFAGNSGKFFWIGDKAVKLDHSDILIEREKVGNEYIFTLTTPNGIEYIFNEADKITSTPNNTTKAPTCSTYPSPIETFYDYGYISAWRVKMIKNKATQAKITFKYKSIVTAQDKDINQTTSLTFSVPENPTLPASYQKDESYNKSITTTYYMDEIESDHYKVIVTTGARSDGGDNKIEMLKLYDKSNLVTPVKTINFTQQYFGNTSAPENCWLKLKKVSINGGGNDLEYEFNYVNETFSSSNLDKEGASIDHWGYYNNANNSTLIPYTAYIQAFLLLHPGIVINDINWANRDPDFTYSKVFALEKTIFPTKGFSKNIYESADSRGIRVTSIEESDGQNSVSRYYNYGAPINYIPAYFGDEYVTDNRCTPTDNSGTIVTTFGSTPDGAAGFMTESENFYENVTEYIGSTDGKGGRTKYTFQKLYGYGNQVLLTEKANYKYGGNDFITKAKYNYAHSITKTVTYWKIPALTATATSGGPCSFSVGLDPSCGPEDPDEGFMFGDFNGGTDNISALWTRLESFESWDGAVHKTKLYTYRNLESSTGLPKHVQPLSAEEILSNGKTKKTYFYYPGDADPDNSSVILGLPRMYDGTLTDFKNIISPVVKTKTFINSALIAQESSQFTYDATHDYILKTGYEVLPAGSTAGRQSINYTYDDEANVISLKKDQDNPQSYIWGYDHRYLTAEVTNAVPSQIAYTSFESGDLGGFTLTGGSTISFGSALTGKFKLSGGVTKTFSSAGTYKVGVWSLANPTINSVVNSQPLITKGSWKYYEVKLTNVTTITITGSTIDEVKLYPPEARMSTYTYDPLVGITTQCDANNRIIYYQYDEFGRLLLIRDDEQNILKKYCYNYSGQTENCTIYQNVLKIKSYTKACNIGGVGSSLNYTVPANKYVSTVSQAAADQQAIDEADIAGQQYANANGTCTYSSIDLSGNYGSNVCTGTTTPQPYYVHLPAGSYTSTISVLDANSQALAYAQSQANTHGACLTMMTLNYANNSSSGEIVYATLTQSPYQFFFELPSGTADSLGNIPAGTYQISIHGESYSISYSFQLGGCGTNVVGTDVFENDVELNSGCNFIIVN